jgi:superfamily II DNA or RNA helicase
MTLPQSTGFKLTIKEKVFIFSPPQDIYSHIIKDNTFANPKYVANERNGYSNWQTQRSIETFKCIPGGLSVLRGYAPSLINLCNNIGAETCIEDLCVTHPTTFPSLSVELRHYQKRAVEQALNVDQGVIVSPTGSGKSLIGLEIIRQRGQKTLIIVHRADLAKQWIDVIKERMGLKAGLIGDGRFEIGEQITVGMIQTISSKDEAKKLGDAFGLVLVDEAHHIPAESFSDAIGGMSAKFLYGLSATVGRRDGLEQMIYRCIGPAIATVSKAEVEALGATVPLSVVSVQTDFNPGPVNSWNEYLDTLTASTARNLLIVDLARRSPDPVLILCDRVAHAEQLSEMLYKRGTEHVIAHGKLKAEDRGAAMVKIKTAHITIGTSGLLGEGLDVASWSVLIMASPISSEIKLMQALGRIVRPAQGKEQGLVYDLRDDCGFAGSSFKNRFAIYKKNNIWVEF